MTNQSKHSNDASIIYASPDQLYLHELNPRLWPDDKVTSQCG